MPKKILQILSVVIQCISDNYEDVTPTGRPKLGLGEGDDRPNEHLERVETILICRTF